MRWFNLRRKESKRFQLSVLSFFIPNGSNPSEQLTRTLALAQRTTSQGADFFYLSFLWTLFFVFCILKNNILKA